MTNFKYTPEDDTLLAVHKRILKELEDRYQALFDAHINRPGFMLRTPEQRALWALERIHDSDMRGAVLQMMYLWASGHEGELSKLLRQRGNLLNAPSNMVDTSATEVTERRDRMLAEPSPALPAEVIDVEGSES
jgi:hypothetical protein